MTPAPLLRSEYSTTIRNAHQLQLVGMNLGASYTLANDINLTADLAAVSNKYPGLWRSTGFVPIGRSSPYFSGTFDGLGHTITGLTIGGSNNRVGLFGVSTGTISNIGIVGGSIAGNGSIGGLVGENQGSISNSYATATVSGGNAIGGLVGYNKGPISNSYAAGAVTGSGAGVGGLVGSNQNLSGVSAVISNSYATGAVTGGWDAWYVGGLVGENGSSISNSYASGAVTGGSSTHDNGTNGGLVGKNAGAITNSYATGSVAGNRIVGGLVGTNSGTVTSSFWDNQTTGKLTSAGGTGKTTAQMKELLTFDATNSANWNIVSDASLSNVYPKLRWATTGLSAGSSVWVIAPPVTVTYTLAALSGPYIYNGSSYLLNSLWNSTSLFGSNYSSWLAGTDYTFQHSGSTVTGFTNANTYSSIGINILRSCDRR